MRTVMRTMANKALLAMALGLVVAACGGPEDAAFGDEYGDGSEALTVSASAHGQAAAATQAATAQGTTIVVDVASGRAVDTSAPAATAYVPVQTAGYLVNGDSSPDPIPARNPSGLIDARPKVLSLADCERMTDAQGRANCFQLLSRGGY